MMAQAVLRIEGLPEGALDAAARFHSEWLPRARVLLNPPCDGRDLVIIFPSAGYAHRGWRLAVVQDLAREAARKRINGVVGDDETAINDMIEWLARSPGITGQLLAVG